MTVSVICITIAVILVIVLILYNMRSMMSAPVPRSERQFPGHSDDASERGQAEAPAGPAPQGSVAPKREPQPSVPEQPAATPEGVEAKTVASASEQPAEARASQKPIAQADRMVVPEANAEAVRTSAKLADPEYRQALRGFAQPAKPRLPSGQAGEAPMKDDDFRTALRSMHNKKK
ncbi:hypothetical protein ABEX47_04065 [Paenibacillus ehimensis]|uniref:hypothetical protein n=1 Tax=Paenibacillus ehimensis TaxID=79264 RepID=UPI00046E6E87|nr:hypothetical protein [Paenibacillus ehimensis]MEC0207455.1 hypothetical protein [Paenibacillus ehimensis]